VVDRPDKKIQAFQKKLRRPGQEQQVRQILANITAKEERDRLRQEQKRRAAGILPLSTPPPKMPTATDAEWIKGIGLAPDEPREG
jgi:hypothetical protein